MTMITTSPPSQAVLQLHELQTVLRAQQQCWRLLLDKGRDVCSISSLHYLNKGSFILDGTPASEMAFPINIFSKQSASSTGTIRPGCEHRNWGHALIKLDGFGNTSVNT